MSANGQTLTPADRSLLFGLQRQALLYFLENQMPNGLFLDRQRNHGPRRLHGLCSTSASGMGFIALALASAPPYRLLSPATAAWRIRTGLQTALNRLPAEKGVVPHFIHSATGEIHGGDPFSTIDTGWLLAGALWSAAFLQDTGLESLARTLYERVDWRYWTAPGQSSLPLLRHGKGHDGAFLRCSWDRLNGETAFLYVLAAGADEERGIPAGAWKALEPFYGTVAGLRFNNADLGLFVFQYSLDLLDLQTWQAPGEVNLPAEARLATKANREACRQTGFATYHRFWGLSAGDGPGQTSESDIYRCYSPLGPIDGTAHVTATLAAIAHEPEAVLENLRQAQTERTLRARGRYGFSNVNVDCNWVGRDMVGIDAGAAVLALDNFLAANRVRQIFTNLPAVRAGLVRLGFTSPEKDQRPEEPPLRRAS